MSRLREPGLGPIVGHTTSTSCRLWIRGSDPADRGANLADTRRTLGVLAITQIGGKPVEKPLPYYFRLHRKYDRTGTFNLGEEKGLKDSKGSPKLKPDTQYQVKMGTLSIDDPYNNDENVSDELISDILPPASVWAEDLKRLSDENSSATFKTFPKDTGDKVSFIVGSCRYPGLLWKAKEADRIFGPILSHLKKNDDDPTPNFTLMVGDQIYADMLNRYIPLGLANTFEEFQDRYHKAFGSTNMRKLLRSIPNYMILDDHEIEDNWHQDRLYKNSKARQIFNLAISAYQSYQWVHSPRNHGKRLYYDFTCNGFPFFVIDTRTQRYMDDIEEDLRDNHLLGRPWVHDEEPSQLKTLTNWLEEKRKPNLDIPKFIVSSSVFVPNPMFAREGRTSKLSPEKAARLKQKSDSWPAFPETRKAILKSIVENQIQNVIFVSGDVHCSHVAKMIFTGPNGEKDFHTYSITSSAFYWPYFFADGDPGEFVHNSKAPGQEDTFEFEANGEKWGMDYEAWNFTQEDNFCRVDLNRTKPQLTVQSYDSKGNPIKNLGNPLKKKLSLTSWKQTSAS